MNEKQLITITIFLVGAMWAIVLTAPLNFLYMVPILITPMPFALFIRMKDKERIYNIYHQQLKQIDTLFKQGKITIVEKVSLEGVARSDADTDILDQTLQEIRK